MVISWLNLFQFLLLVLSLLLGYYLLSTRRAYALATYFLVLAVHNGIRLGVNLEMISASFDISAAFRFLYGVLVFFAVKEILYHNFQYKPVYLWHLIPTLLAMAVPLFSAITVTDLGVFVAILQVVYIVACYRILFQANTVIDATRSSGTPDAATWLFRALTIYSVMLVFEISRYFIGFITSAYVNELSHLLFVALTCLFLAILVYQGLRNPSLLPAINEEERALSRHLNDCKDRQLSAFDTNREQQLTAYMRDQKPYLNAQITIRELADALGIPARSLSELINTIYGCNFSEFINRIRVTEAQALMAVPENNGQSLLDIGLASGFNSKTSFNVMFKRFVGQTPSSYRKTLGDNSAAISDLV